MNSNLAELLAVAGGASTTEQFVRCVHVPTFLKMHRTGVVSRVELAQALNMALFAGLLLRVPTGLAYTEDVLAAGERVVFDHGALRTVLWPHTGSLPAGESAFTRIFEPLGYILNGTYPLERIAMTGRSYAHADAPAEIAQYFLSELHPERFSPAFQAAVTRVLSTSVDPLTPRAQALLHILRAERQLPLAQACELLPVLVQCFARQHATPHLADYLALREESAEMAWIATEGNAFNHATDRVPDVFGVADAQRALGRPIKDSVEVSQSGRVKQTAFRADPVQREFIGEHGELLRREVPGSFYEFITRDTMLDPATGQRVLDLGFDAGNATGIFKMTATA
jgi:hypothetical protein